MKTQTIVKIIVFITWPIIASIIALLVPVLLMLTWIWIPFGYEYKEKP